MTLGDSTPGPGEASARGRELLLTNGLSTTATFWRDLVAGVPDRAVSHWSYRGHGQSEEARTGGYALATHVDDLLHVTEALRASGAPAPIHVGFSMGVTVVLALYRARPDLVGGLVLVGGGADHPYAASPLFRVPGARATVRGLLGGAKALSPAFAPLMAKVTASSLLFPAARAVGALGESAPRTEMEAFFRSVGEMPPRAYWGTLHGLMEARTSDTLPSVRVPTLVLAPERDVMALRADLEALRDRIPGAGFCLFPGTGHGLLLEAGDAVAARVRAFARAVV